MLNSATIGDVSEACNCLVHSGPKAGWYQLNSRPVGLVIQRQDCVKFMKNKCG